MAHELPKLPYDFAALEPHIDAQTMQIHHGKHHQTYVTNLNNALAKHPELQGKSVEELCKGLSSLPRGHPDRGAQQRRRPLEPQQVLDVDGARTPAARRRARSPTPSTASFGSFDAFKEQWGKAGAGRFGSGWVWLLNDGGKLSIASTPNQDNPLMEGKTADPRPRRLGARLLPEVSEPPARLHRRLVERGELGRGEQGAVVDRQQRW